MPYQSLRLCLLALTAAFAGACGGSGGAVAPADVSDSTSGESPSTTRSEPPAGEAPPPGPSDAFLEELAVDPDAVAAGREVFVGRCVPCHGVDAGGVIGPNLTDDYWIHGGDAQRIFMSIEGGVPSHGMPGWGVVLGATTTEQVAAYVISLRGHGVEGRAPEGERWAPR
jgi:mono/diheme cytochrome c family protein